MIRRWRQRRELRARIKHAEDARYLYIDLAKRTGDSIDWNEVRFFTTEIIELRRRYALRLPLK